MTVQILENEFPTDHMPLLRWLMFTGVCAFGFVHGAGISGCSA